MMTWKFEVAQGKPACPESSLEGAPQVSANDGADISDCDLPT